MKFLIALFLLPVALKLHADAHHVGILSSLNLGIRYSSVLANRGVILYRDFQVDPVVGAFFFDDRVEFVGDSLGFRDFVIEDRVRLRTRLVSLTDKPLFPNHESVRADLPSRPDTYEWSNSVEWFWPHYGTQTSGDVDFSFAKDLSAHHGYYFELLAKFKILSTRLGPTLTEPNVFASLGAGDVAHNRYWYGPEAAGGLNNWSAGLWLALPEEADRYYPIVQLKYFEVLGQKNRTAAFAESRDRGVLFSFIATYGVLE